MSNTETKTTETLRPIDDPRTEFDDERVTDLLDTLTRKRGTCLKLTRSGEETTTAFATYDREEQPYDRFYWFEYGEDDYGHPVQRDSHVPRATLEGRLDEWGTPMLCESDEFAEALVSTTRTSRWFWAKSLGALEAQLKVHYHKSLYIASTEVHTGGLAVGTVWPTTKPASADRGDNPRTAQDRSVLEKTVFFETPLYQGHGYYAVELPRRDLLREAFRDSRPSVEDATRCEACANQFDASRRFCDWCGRSQAAHEEPFVSRAKRTLRTLPERVVRSGGSLVERAMLDFEKRRWSASVRLRQFVRRARARFDSEDASGVPLGKRPGTTEGEATDE